MHVAGRVSMSYLTLSKFSYVYTYTPNDPSFEMYTSSKQIPLTNLLTDEGLIEGDDIFIDDVLVLTVGATSTLLDLLIAIRSNTTLNPDTVLGQLDSSTRFFADVYYPGPIPPEGGYFRLVNKTGVAMSWSSTVRKNVNEPLDEIFGNSPVTASGVYWKQMQSTTIAIDDAENTTLYYASGNSLPTFISTIQYNGYVIMTDVDTTTATIQDLFDSIASYSTEISITFPATLIDLGGGTGYIEVIDEGCNPICITYDGNFSTGFPLFGMTSQASPEYTDVFQP